VKPVPTRALCSLRDRGTLTTRVCPAPDSKQLYSKSMDSLRHPPQSTCDWWVALTASPLRKRLSDAERYRYARNVLGPPCRDVGQAESRGRVERNVNVSLSNPMMWGIGGVQVVNWTLVLTDLKPNASSRRVDVSSLHLRAAGQPHREGRWLVRRSSSPFASWVAARRWGCDRTRRADHQVSSRHPASAQSLSNSGRIGWCTSWLSGPCSAWCLVAVRLTCRMPELHI